jgi:N-acetylglucosaminyl-diphospho-decaprenol L-rhamnosyltransferase
VISFIVVTWNSAPELADLLRSVERHLAGRCEVVVVDNASTDGTRDVVEDGARLLALDENRGFGAAANAGVRAASHEAVVLLNPDTSLVDDSLPALAELAMALGAIAGPELLNADGTRQPSASARPAGWEAALEAVVPAGLLPPPLRVRVEPWRSARTTSVGWLTGACLAASRSVFLGLGPFDESLHLFGEDLDLGLRARRAGVPLLYAPEVARIVHLGGRSSTRRFPRGDAALKLAARREVVRRRIGPRRERLDLGTQIAFHTTRWLAKRALRRDAQPERDWIGALTASRRGRRSRPRPR